MALRFSYAQRAIRVEFGEDATTRVGGVMDSVLGTRRCAIVSTPGRAAVLDMLRRGLGGDVLDVFDRAVVHVPVTVVDEAVKWVAAVEPKSIIALGGGSAIGLGKAIVKRTHLPLVAIPTTYSGSEMTDIWGMTEGNRKETGRDPQVAPRIVVYDPRLTYSMPSHVTGPSGMNAIAHGVEALYSSTANPVSSLLAMEGIRLLVSSLAVAVEHPEHVSARHDALCGAHFCGVALDRTSMGLHHKLCHALGGALDLPHALTHAIVLPYAVAYNASAASSTMELLSPLLGSDDVPRALWDLNHSLGITQTLGDLGVTANDVESVTQMVANATFPNPAAVTAPGVRRLLENATAGVGP